MRNQAIPHPALRQGVRRHASTAGGRACRSPGGRAVAVVGPLDAPVAGNVVATQVVCDHLAGTHRVVRMNTLTNDRNPLRGGVTRLWLYAVAAMRFASAGLLMRRRDLFLAMNSGNAILLDATVVLLARTAGSRIVLHHHTVNYLVRPSLRMRLVLGLAGRRALQVVPSRAFEDDLRKIYPVVGRCLLLPLAMEAEIRPARTTPSAGAGRPVVGFLSNLIPGKGVDDFLSLVETCRRRGDALRFVIAGRGLDPALRARVEAYCGRHPGVAHYVGAVSGEAKEKFFREIDILCFCSRQESWGIVVTEAMRRGVPVICANNRYTRQQFDEDLVREFDPTDGQAIEKVRGMILGATSRPEAICAWRAGLLRNYRRLRGEFQCGLAGIDRFLRDGCNP